MQFPGHATRFIVLAEDDHDDQEMLQFAFREVDPQMRLICLPNGKKFMNWLGERPDDALPSVIVLDYNLPELNGAEIMQLLGPDERLRNIPKIIWSTSNSPVFRSICMDLGASDYIAKPSDLASYIAIARHILSFM
ncbi:response regulator [Chitinophaga sp. GCM10012297]|uniref:Response regulator n=1 Tax=Chitinophaga chungangae TaxID=2821488 RepID=A0ABS3YC87_9BACT|nr:response regulator [Chitinophaga chungangae]MBO9152301.1 response regulator [Chitinophaga chungangae]